jgi:predicted O-linked N-acetylglucosamine transferase (SPINDLY family)
MTRRPPLQRTDDSQRSLNIALQAHQRGDLDTARAGYLAVLAAHPRNVDALYLLGVLCTETDAVDEGIALLHRALAVHPTNAAANGALAGAMFAKGNSLQRHEALAESVGCYREAIRRRPVFPEAFNNLAAALRGLRRFEDALASASQALVQRPDYPQALNNRGLIQLDGKRGAAAVEDFRRALALNPTFAEAWHNLGTALMQQNRYAEAREAFGQVARIAPQFPHVLGNLAYAKLCDCDWMGWGDWSAALIEAVERGAHAALPLAFLCVSGSTAAQLRCAEAFTRAHYPPRAPAIAAPPSFHHEKKIRVAYLSGDLGEHAVTYLLAGVLERHDSDRFETFGLAWNRQAEGPARQRVERAFTRFIDIGAESDREVVRLMRELEVDIAIDLSGHTLGQRTAILAQRAAPVQVNYLGLPATMGAPYMDYLIADRFLIPEDQEQWYSEKVVCLDGCFQPNDDRRPPPPPAPTRASLGLPEHALVFCCFNRSSKLNPGTFGIWMRLLQHASGSVLWLLATHPGAAASLRREAATRGVAPDRLVFADQVPYLDYLARYRHADLFLDTSPFNGGATVSDALSMGVPVLTVAGSSFSARMAGSLLQNLGLAELVACSLPDYEATGHALAAEPARLLALRQRLEQQHQDHPVFDTDRYRRTLESAYERMWERNAAGLPPCSFVVPGQPMIPAP